MISGYRTTAGMETSLRSPGLALRTRTYSTAVARFQTFWSKRTPTLESTASTPASAPSSKFEALRSMEIAANNEPDNIDLQASYLHELYR